MQRTLLHFLFKCILIGLGLAAAEATHSGIVLESTQVLILVSLLLGILNAFVRPFLVFFTLPFVIFTFGLGLVVINAVIILLAGQMVGGFSLDSFWAALWAAFLVSVVSLLVTLLFGFRKVKGQTRFTYTAHIRGRDGSVREFGNRKPGESPRRIGRPRGDDDVIDI